MLTEPCIISDESNLLEDDLQKYTEDYIEAFEEDQLPTTRNSRRMGTDETTELSHRILKRRSTSNTRSNSIASKEDPTYVESNLTRSPDQNNYSSRSVRRRVDNEPTGSRSSSYKSYSPAISTPSTQYHLTTPSPQRYMYPTNSANYSLGLEGSPFVENGTLERNVAAMHIGKDTLTKQQQSSFLEQNLYGSTPFQSIKPSIPLPTENSIPTTVQKLEKIIVNGNEYTILKEIGKGSSGKVYQVISHTYGEIYALKAIEIKRPEDHRSTLNEIELLTSLREEENIITLVDYYITPSVIYMIMEYGEIDLATLIQNHSRKEWDIFFIKYYWRQMLYAVDAIHKRQIVHSDLKPANFVLSKGRLKLIDFGIAKEFGDDTTNIHRDIQVGTINYMSPEALSDINEGTDGAGSLIKLGTPSDIWSLACILYQMVYGKTPFYQLTVAQKIAKIPNPQYKIYFSSTIEYGPTAIRAEVPSSLIRLLSRCLDRTPRLRPTMNELLNHAFVNP